VPPRSTRPRLLWFTFVLAIALFVRALFVSMPRGLGLTRCWCLHRIASCRSCDCSAIPTLFSSRTASTQPATRYRLKLLCAPYQALLPRFSFPIARARPLTHSILTQGDEVYLNLVLESVPETLSRVARHYAKVKRTIPLIYTKVRNVLLRIRFKEFCL